MKSVLLDFLYQKYDIANLKFGTVHDKLGDLYEEFCVNILQNHAYLSDFQNGIKRPLDWEYGLFCEIMTINNISDIHNIVFIKASNIVPVRMSHGPSKTDVIATINYKNGNKFELPISTKQTTVPKVAFAEFDTATIIREVGIKDTELIRLITKHQIDCSAKNFTVKEKESLRKLLEPISREFVRWVVTGSTSPSTDSRIPLSIIKFYVNKHGFTLKKYSVFTIEEYIDTIMSDKKGRLKKGGFGTGLSWTYATRSRNKKIQFKG